MKIPLRLTCAVKASSATRAVGLIYATQKAGGAEFNALLVQWDQTPFAVYLNGARPFRFFELKPGITLRGLLINEPEIMVDPTSRYDSVQSFDPLGALVMRGGRAHIAAAALSDGFSDVAEVPLWGEFEGAPEEEAIGFLRWSLAVHDGSHLVEIWNHQVEPED